MKKISIIIGTRPEAIKLAPVILAFRRLASFIDVRVVFTGQHRHMANSIFEFFDIIPSVDLQIMTDNQSLASLTANLMLKFNDEFNRHPPEAIVVQGDTTSAMVAALCGFYMRIPVFHVEAGLRTNNMLSPFPEELNRTIISHLVLHHFPPTKFAATCLKALNIKRNQFTMVGNTVVDALRIAIEKNKISKGGNQSIVTKLEIDTTKNRMLLVTAHRRESFGQGFANICNAILNIISAIGDVVIVFPVHLNPNVREPVLRLLNGNERIKLVPPLDYPDFVEVMSKSKLILTDSGGVQEEAPFLGKPILVMREVTERNEGVKCGAAVLVGTDVKTITDRAIEILENPKFYNKMAKHRNVYGDGFASDRIVEVISDILNRK